MTKAWQLRISAVSATLFDLEVLCSNKASVSYALASGDGLYGVARCSPQNAIGSTDGPYSRSMNGTRCDAIYGYSSRTSIKKERIMERLHVVSSRKQSPREQISQQQTTLSWPLFTTTNYCIVETNITRLRPTRPEGSSSRGLTRPLILDQAAKVEAAQRPGWREGQGGGQQAPGTASHPSTIMLLFHAKAGQFSGWPGREFCKDETKMQKGIVFAQPSSSHIYSLQLQQRSSSHTSLDLGLARSHRQRLVTSFSNSRGEPGRQRVMDP